MGQPCPVKLDDVNLSSGVVENILASQSYLLDWDDVTWCFSFQHSKIMFFKTSLGRPWKIHVRKKEETHRRSFRLYWVNHLAELTKDHPVQVGHVVLSCKPSNFPARGMSMHSTGPLHSFTGWKNSWIFLWVRVGLNVRPEVSQLNEQHQGGHIIPPSKLTELQNGGGWFRWTSFSFRDFYVQVPC